MSQQTDTLNTQLIIPKTHQITVTGQELYAIRLLCQYARAGKRLAFVEFTERPPFVMEVGKLEG